MKAISTQYLVQKLDMNWARSKLIDSKRHNESLFYLILTEVSKLLRCRLSDL